MGNKLNRFLEEDDEDFNLGSRQWRLRFGVCLADHASRINAYAASWGRTTALVERLVAGELL